MDALMAAQMVGPAGGVTGVDVVISNGVIDLVPDKDAVFGEILRVMRPGGRIQIADVTLQEPVSEGAKRDIDLWAQ